MFEYFVIAVIYIPLAFSSVDEDLFTAITHLGTLRDTHTSVVLSLEYYLEAEQKRLETLSKYLADFKKEQKLITQNSKYLENPINVFNLINSLRTELEKIKFYAKYKAGYERRPDVTFPVKEDVEGAARAVWRLQRTYGLNITQLAAGKLRGTFSQDKTPFEEETLPMSVFECFEVGRMAYNEGDYESSISWMNHALTKYNKTEPTITYVFDEPYIMEYISNSYLQLDDVTNAVKWSTKSVLEAGKSYNTRKNYPKIDLWSNLDDRPNTIFSNFKNYNKKYMKKYRSLCRGKLPLPEYKRKSLHCFYKSDSAFLRLARVRTELLHQNPEVYLFYDVMKDEEIRHIRHISRDRMTRSMVGVEKKTAAHFRISKCTWLELFASDVVTRLSQRIEYLTGLTTIGAEDLQVVNYGIGGHYEPHFDSVIRGKLNDPELPFGDRIATILFYMSNVEQGGATVFLSINLTVFPIKNAAIFWMNVLPSGELDHRTKHGACPVLRGSKWIANKWLHCYGQEFRRPCTLKYQENKDILINEYLEDFIT